MNVLINPMSGNVKTCQDQPLGPQQPYEDTSFLEGSSTATLANVYNEISPAFSWPTEQSKGHRSLQWTYRAFLTETTQKAVEREQCHMHSNVGDK